MRFLTEERVRIYARAVALTFMLLYAGLMLASYRSYAATGEPLPGHDFLLFYGAGLMSRAGNAAMVYDIEALSQAIREAFPPISGQGGWFYPPIYLPPFQLIAGLPYYMAYLSWLVCTGLFYLWAIRPFVGRSAEGWVILTFPALWFNILFGQNAFLTGGLIALFFRLYRERSSGAGVALGLLAIKPHLAVILPVVVLAQGRWKTIAVAAFTFAALTAGSILLYGPGIWAVFFTENAAGVSHLVASGQLPWGQMASPYVFALSFGAPLAVAKVAQLIFCAATVLLVLRFILRGVPGDMVFAFAMAAAVPFSPLNYVYDWVLFILPVLILLRTVGAGSVKWWEWAILAGLHIAPFVLLSLPHGAAGAPGFVPVAALWLLIANRCRAAPDVSATRG